MTRVGYTLAVTTYEPTGATLDALNDDAALPAGFRHLLYRVRIGYGQPVLQAAGEAIMSWELHRKAGVRPRPSAPRAAPGVTVVSSVPIPAPCVVVWVLERPDRVGFGYGTMEGHPFSGEESFTAWTDAAGDVWFSVIAFSRPVRWFTKMAGPVAPLFQRAYARHLARVLRRLASGA
jgi:uncharacterized protein (UPF0548 family)